MDIQPTDIAILLVSFAACIYCVVLSRRLKALQNTKDGLGATIMAFSKSISAMSSTTQETRVYAGELASRLSELMEEAEATCSRIETLTRDMETRHGQAIRGAKATQAELSELMQEVLADSRRQVHEMNTLAAQMRSLTDKTAVAIHRAVTQTPPHDAGLSTEAILFHDAN